MNKNTLSHLFFKFSAYILLILTNITLIGADFHQIPKHLFFQDNLTENVVLFQSNNNDENPQKYVVKGYSDKDKAIAELTASNAARQTNITIPYVQQVPQDTLFEMPNTTHTTHDLAQDCEKQAPFKI